MTKNNIKRFYVMPEVWVTVTQSQVFNWIKLINESGISTDCISITNQKNSVEDIDKIEKSIKGKFYEIHNFNRLVISDFYVFFTLFKLYLKNVFKYDKIIFQSRVQIGFAYFFLGLLPKVKLIFEGRGASNEERAYSHSTEGNRSLKTIIKNFIFKNEEKLMITRSDKIICVSNALKKYYEKKFNITQNKFNVFPGAADSELFFQDQTLRNDMRKNLNINIDDILVVYSGRLEMKWEIPDKMFDFFLNLNSKNNNFKLLLLTPDAEMAYEFIKKYKVEKAVMVRTTSLKEVNGYLNASDVGLLLREDAIMNNVASPTKFAEYIMSGLPVIISTSVHDFSEIVNQTGYGASVQHLDKILDQEYKKLNKSLSTSKIEISQWGLENLSKKRYINEYVHLLKNV